MRQRASNGYPSGTRFPHRLWPSLHIQTSFELGAARLETRGFNAGAPRRRLEFRALRLGNCGAGDPVARLLITRLINNAATSNEGRRAESEKEREREEGDRRLIIISGGATMSAVTMSEISSLAAGALHATETPRARVHSSRYVDF